MIRTRSSISKLTFAKELRRLVDVVFANLQKGEGHIGGNVDLFDTLGEYHENITQVLVLLLFRLFDDALKF